MGNNFYNEKFKGIIMRNVTENVCVFCYHNDNNVNGYLEKVVVSENSVCGITQYSFYFHKDCLIKYLQNKEVIEKTELAVKIASQIEKDILYNETRIKKANDEADRLFNFFYANNRK
jgi:nitrate/TMAO reductase-like tetraheme cytochrome c subunit